jgi:hypothetical protein
LKGDHSQFVRADELEYAWRIFTPLLNKIDADKIVPEPYPYGSRGPESSDVLAKKHGYVTANKHDPVTGRWAFMDEHRDSVGKSITPGALTGKGLEKVTLAEQKE